MDCPDCRSPSVCVCELLPSLSAVLYDVEQEVNRVEDKWPPFNSAHEGYAVLLEEVDELKAHVWTNQKRRNLPEMRAEAVQVAAVAVRFVRMIDAGKGRV